MLKIRSKRSIARDKPASPMETKVFMEVIKMITPKKVVIQSETSDGTEATIKALAKPDPGDRQAGTTGGTIVLFKEDEQWKLDGEKRHLKVGDQPPALTRMLRARRMLWARWTASSPCTSSGISSRTGQA